jgi:hypothetical protein
MVECPTAADVLALRHVAALSGCKHQRLVDCIALLKSQHQKLLRRVLARNSR